MPRLQPVCEMNLPIAQLTPSGALSALEEEGASSAHLGKRPSSPTLRKKTTVSFGKHTHLLPKTSSQDQKPPGNSSLCGGWGKPTVLGETKKETTIKK